MDSRDSGSGCVSLTGPARGRRSRTFPSTRRSDAYLVGCKETVQRRTGTRIAGQHDRRTTAVRKGYQDLPALHLRLVQPRKHPGSTGRSSRGRGELFQGDCAVPGIIGRGSSPGLWCQKMWRPLRPLAEPGDGPAQHPRSQGGSPEGSATGQHAARTPRRGHPAKPGAGGGTQRLLQHGRQELQPGHFHDGQRGQSVLVAVGHGQTPGGRPPGWA
mmetsp:Transcript_23413/g.55163  ORF Transcript_23413/g.55163 Transcript_23413/m.55163 type:complete len:215 (+) Transcript_23413:348-992(+)